MINLIKSFSSKLTDSLNQLPRVFIQSTRDSTIKLLDSLVKRRLPNQILEWERLKTRPRVAHSLEFIEKTFANDAQKVAFGHSLELQEALKDTHFVINHGQNNAGLIVHLVSRKAREVFENKQYQYFEILRHPVFIEHLQEENDVCWFREVAENNADYNYRNELISGDIFLENQDHLESSIDFFVREESIAFSSNYGLAQNLIEGILRKYTSTQNSARSISERITQEKLPGSSLYSICVPKEKFSSIGYLSRGWGRIVTQAYKTSDLDLCQQGWVPGHLKSFGQSPQVRLVTSRLTPENGVFILHHTTLDPKQIKEMESKVVRALLRASI